MGSRVRVAAAACLMASGLFAGAACGAVAFADPDESDGVGGAGAVGGGTGETGAATSAATPAVRAPGTRAGRRGPHPHPSRIGAGGSPDGMTPGPKSAVDDSSSKQPEGAGGGRGTGPADGAGEQPEGHQDAAKGEQPDPADPQDPDDDPDDCLPWWWPKPGATHPGNGGGGVGSGAPKAPTGRPAHPPVMQLPERAPKPTPNGEAPALTAVPDIALPPVALPGITVSPGAGGPPPDPSPPPPVSHSPGAPPTPAPPPRTPVQAVDNPLLPASYRAGYGEYLRTADISHVVAVAVPGFTGIMVLTGAGGIIGYRQARSALAVRSTRSARFTS